MSKRLLHQKCLTLLLLGMMANAPAWADDVASITSGSTTTPYATLQAAFDAVADGQTITLLNDASGDGIKFEPTTTKSVTLNLGGHTYDVSGAAVGSKEAVRLGAGNTVTIKNGTLKATSTGVNTLVNSYANLTLEGVTVDGSANSKITKGVVCVNYGSLTTTGETKIRAYSNAYAVYTNYGTAEAYDGGMTVTIGDGTAISGVVFYTKYSRRIKASNTTWPEKVNVSISSKADITNAGFGWVSGITPTMTIGDDKVSEKTFVASINSCKYLTVEAAFANAAGTTKNVEILQKGTYTVPEAIATKGIYIKKPTTVTDGDVTLTLPVQSDGTLTLGASQFSSVKLDFGSAETVTINSTATGAKTNDYVSFVTCSFDKPIITSGGATKFTSCTFTQGSDAQYCVQAGGTATEFVSCTFNCSSAEAVKLYAEDETARTVKMTTSNKFNATASLTKPAVMLYTTYKDAESESHNLNYTVTLSGTLTVSDNFTATEATAKATDGLWGADATTATASTITVKGEQAFPSLGNIISIGETNYQSFVTAMETVKDGETLKLLADVTYGYSMTVGAKGSENARAFTIDLNGHTLNANSFIVYDNITITDSNTGGTEGSVVFTKEKAGYGFAVYGTLNLDKGNLKYTNTASYGTVVQVQGTGVANIKGGTVSTIKGASGAISVSGTLNVSGGTITNSGSYSKNALGNSAAIYCGSQSDVDIDITGGTITSTNGYALCNSKSPGTIDITGGTLTGKISAVYNYCYLAAKSSTLTISGGSFNSTDTWVVSYLMKNGTVNISDGTFTGPDGLCGYGTRGYAGNTVNITGGKFNVTNAGMYFPNNDAVNVSNCKITVTGNGAGIVAMAGDVTLGEGVEVSVSGTGTCKVGDSGNELSCSAVVFDSKANYPGLQANTASKVAVTGGTYTANSSTKAVSVVAADGATNATQYLAVTGGSYSDDSPKTYLANSTAYQVTSSSSAGSGSAYTVSVNTDAVPKVTKSDGTTGTAVLAPDANNAFNITDGDYASFSNSTAYTGVTVNYTRTFESVGWYSWFTPFTFTVTDDMLKQATFAYPVAIMNESEDNAAWTVAVVKLKAGETVKANLPYVIKPVEADGSAMTLTISDANLAATSTSSPVDISNVIYKMEFTGSYDSQAFNNDIYGLSSNGSGFIKAASGNTSKPFRFYMNLSDNADNPYASTSTAKPAFIGVTDFADEVTAIRAINSAVSSGDSTEVYDLQGRKVSRPVKGIYIVGGKKVIMK